MIDITTIIAKTTEDDQSLLVDLKLFNENGGGVPSSSPSIILSPTKPLDAKNGDEWLSTNTGIKYTFLNNKWVEV